MSFLTQKLPDSVEYGGRSYAVKTDFRDWLRFYEEGEKNNLVGMLGIYRELPPSAETALRLAAEFGSGGALGYKEERQKRPVLDYELDGPLIYAAFLAEYGIDLCEEELHWYKFCALVNGLGEDRRISKIMALRSADPAGEKDAGRRKELRRLQRIYACPDRRTAEEKDRAAAEELGRFY